MHGAFRASVANATLHSRASSELRHRCESQPMRSPPQHGSSSFHAHPAPCLISRGEVRMSEAAGLGWYGMGLRYERYSLLQGGDIFQPAWIGKRIEKARHLCFAFPIPTADKAMHGCLEDVSKSRQRFQAGGTSCSSFAVIHSQRLSFTMTNAHFPPLSSSHSSPTRRSPSAAFQRSAPLDSTARMRPSVS